MARVNFTVQCNALYHSHLDIPDEIVKDDEQTLEYIREHLNDAPVIDIEFLSDIDPNEAVTADDLRDTHFTTEYDNEEFPPYAMRI